MIIIEHVTSYIAVPVSDKWVPVFDISIPKDTLKKEKLERSKAKESDDEHNPLFEDGTLLLAAQYVCVSPFINMDLRRF